MRLFHTMPLFRTMPLIGILVGITLAAAEEKPAASPSVEGSPLKSLQDFVGHWKGVGQVRRGSTQGSWIEEADWRWDFHGSAPAILFTAPASKHVVEGRITAKADKGSEFNLAVKRADGSTIAYDGSLDAEDESLTFICDDAPDGAPHRIAVRFAAEKKRLVVALERRLGGEAYARLAEIGYTREGSDFGKGGGAGPLCIVTGGAGTITVGYQGKTYYVCCTGCKDLFESDPAKFVAEYEAKRKQK